MFKPKLSKPDQGFTIFEVLVAILIATIFVAITMQMMAISAVFKVRAQEFAEATNWIQEDLENVKYQAGLIGIRNIDSMTAADNLITVSDHGVSDGTPVAFQGNGIASPLQTNTTYYVVIDGTVTDPANTFKVSSTAGGSAIDLTSDSSGDLVGVATEMCGTAATPATRTTGYADALRDLITASNETGNSNVVTNPASSGNAQTAGTNLSSKLFTDKTFELKRTTTIADIAPYNVLQINYTVTPSSDTTKKIAEFYTEVIPNAALQCPSP